MWSVESGVKVALRTFEMHNAQCTAGTPALAFPLWGKVARAVRPVTDEGQQRQRPRFDHLIRPLWGHLPRQRGRQECRSQQYSYYPSAAGRSD